MMTDQLDVDAFSTFLEDDQFGGQNWFDMDFGEQYYNT